MTNRIPYNIIKEADELSRDAGLPFRDCLDKIYSEYLLKEDTSAYKQNVL